MNSAVDIRNDLLSAYLDHWRTLRIALKRRTGSPELAEDALQETWLRIASLKEPPETVRDMQAFILRIAGNIAIDLQRKENRHLSRCISDEELMLSIADNCPSPETRVIDRDKLRRLAIALGQLPVKQRSALIFARCDGLTHAEIARRLNVSPSMVAKYLAQALRHCRDHMRISE